jgi:hypothetical protein
MLFLLFTIEVCEVKQTTKTFFPFIIFQDYNIFVLVFIAHGDKKNNIMVSDSDWASIEDIKKMVDNVEALFGIPKLFIFDCCRGKRHNRPKIGSVPSVQDRGCEGNFYSYLIFF